MKIVELHERMGGDGTLVLHPVKDPRRLGIVRFATTIGFWE
jgi:dTDP-glucose pyrophosphorylase